MDVRITLTDPRHECVTIQESAGRPMIVAHGAGAPVHLVLHEGHQGHEELARLAAQINAYLTLQGWTTGDAA